MNNSVFKRIMENGDSLIISFNLVNFKYDIKYDATWKRFRNSISNEFNLVYIIYYLRYEKKKFFYMIDIIQNISH